VQNGSFEDGLLGVNSDYLHTPLGNTDEGTFWITPLDPGAAWGPPQSASNVGRMNVNGDGSSLAATNRVWWQTVNVMAGNTYEFSAMAWATHEGEDGYQLRFAFDDVQIGSTMLASQAGLWESFRAQYFAAVTGPVEISVVNVSDKTFPNDFMLDDVSLTVTDAGAVPEPMSLLGWSGMAGVGVIGVWHRSRTNATTPRSSRSPMLL
jgi:hypothetical protein